MKLITLALALMLFIAPNAGRAAQSNSAEMVDVALVLAVDVSNSVTAERYRLQMDGIAKAFEDPGVQDAILSGPHRSMFVTLVEWSNEPHVALPWTLITSPSSAQAFADKVSTAPRAEHDFTCMATALKIVDGKILPLLPVPAERVIVDVSGDGHDNCNLGESVDTLRDQLVAEGATINGLPILEGDEADTLEQWYRDHVIGGNSAFLIPAHGFADFERAMRQKFITEISGTAGTTRAGGRGVADRKEQRAVLSTPH